IKKGLSFGISASGGWQKILSSTNFIQTNIELKGIYTFKHDIRFLGRTDVGITRAKDFYKVPLSLRFMTGGDKSVRGYKYRAIGPIEIDDTGRRIVVGGRYQWINSIEFDKKITEELRIAAFIDAGNAMNHFKDKLKIGTGIGIRWATPVGPLHVDIAYPLSKEIPRRYKRYLHVTFGWEL
ncbi:MAG: surface antigen, partial [Francisellaceae bacterium]|nr:surface antigen [Francisellaceae bacterium]